VLRLTRAARVRRAAVVFCLTLLVLGIAYVGCFLQVDGGRAGGIEETRDAFFTPGDQTTKEVVALLNAATATVHVQAYSFTSAPIAEALVEAKRRGVDVIAVLDRTQQTANYSSADFLAHEGVATFIDSKHAIVHNKIMIIDGGTVITGSFNFTARRRLCNASHPSLRSLSESKPALQSRT